MKEREVEKMLVDGIRKLGGRAFKWVSPGNDGVPDRIVVLPGLPAIFVELKTITGRLTSLQRVQLKRLKDLGQTVMVLYGEKEIKMYDKRSALVDLGKHLGLFNSDKEQEKPIQITFVKASEKQDGG